MSTPAQAPRKAAATPPAFEELRVSPLRNTVLLDYLAKEGGFLPALPLGECVRSITARAANGISGSGSGTGRAAWRYATLISRVRPPQRTSRHLRHGAGGNGKATALVFEGFMDYLSYLTLKQGKPVPDCVVLNSVGNLPGALDVLKGYGHVCCFLDNDDAGRKTTEEIRRQCGA